LEALFELGLISASSGREVASQFDFGADENPGGDVGSKKRLTYRINEDHALSTILRKLFEEEHSVYSLFENHLIRLIEDLSPPPISVWLEGDFVSGNDDPGSGLILCILAPDKDLSILKQQVQDRLRRDNLVPLGLNMHVKTLSKADLMTGGLPDDCKVIFGISPIAILHSARGKSGHRSKIHHEHDKCGLERSRAMARSLSKHPKAIEVALHRIEKFLQTAAASEQKTLMEWRDILMMASVATIKGILSDPGERGTRLRQSNPFFPEDFK
jgi:hypothetical protein